MKTSLLVLTLILGTTFTAQAAVVDRESTKMSKAAGSGTNVGGGNTGSEYLSTWCKGQTSVLRNYRDRARLKLENTGDYNIANKILTDGMIQALSNGANAGDTFLHKSLVRGLKISKQLGAQTTNADRKAMVTNNILNSYYDFVLEVVAKDLDLNGHLPYLGASHGDLNRKAAHYEERFIIYAAAQLNWILDNLVKEVRLGNKMQTVPVGDAKSILKVILTVSAGTATDLDESLWSNRFSCAISDLGMLLESLTAYDQGNKEMFEDEKQALTYASSEIKRIAKTVTLRETCQ
jgi:hypothetical protein